MLVTCEVARIAYRESMYKESTTMSRSADSKWSKRLEAIYQYFGMRNAAAKTEVDPTLDYLTEHPEAQSLFIKRFLKHPAWSLEVRVFLCSSMVAEKPTLLRMVLAARVLDQCVSEPPYFNTLLYTLLRVVFTTSHQILGLDHDTYFRDEIWPAYCRFLNVHFSSHSFSIKKGQEPADNERVAVITPQLLHLKHSPTQVVLEYARTLIIKNGNKVLVAQTELFPQVQEAPVCQPFIANRLPSDSKPLGLLRYEGAQMKRWRSPQLEFNVEKVMQAVRTVDAYSPSVILSYGNWNMVADVLSKRYPVIHLPSVGGPAMSLGHLLLRPKDHHSKPKLMPGQIGEYASFPFSPLKAPESNLILTRAELGLPERAFCFVVVGNRLPVEIDKPFVEFLETLLEPDPDSHVIFIGNDADGQWEAQLPERLRRQMSYRPFQQDLGALYRVVDVFLNPFRQGGGVSAFLAMKEGVPIVTLDHGDVASYLGEELASLDIQAYQHHARRLRDDADYFGEVVQATRQRAAEIPFIFDSSEYLASVCEEAKARFNVIGSTASL